MCCAHLIYSIYRHVRAQCALGCFVYKGNREGKTLNRNRVYINIRSWRGFLGGIWGLEEEMTHLNAI